MVTRSLLLAGRMARRIGRKRQKLMDWHKDSITEQQGKRKTTIIILIKRIHKTRNTQCNFLTA